MTELAYPIAFVGEADKQIDELSDTVFDRVERSMSLLSRHPYLGREYNPAYDAALPPVSCRVLYVGNTTKAIYYFVDEERQRVFVFYIGDARSDPMTRFVGIHFFDMGG